MTTTETLSGLRKVPIAIYLAGAAVISLIALTFTRETNGIDLADVDAADALAR